LHPEQLRAALSTTTPAPAAPVQQPPAPVGVGMGPTVTHSQHGPNQRIMVRRVTRRYDLVIGLKH